ncbi:MAG: CAAD domain-containing protein [Aulosira sp. ZfuVER01]|nr:CAAD domain-containing protein [Aulosira sp. ZfuVER01]MDZ8000263.1 CAAD domain-containing protein [Aulosira sp. DedVER01a]MDZ8053369.1 CAAD domain-containing protein [Aulosira sp. ZfuCHP01]
MQVQEQQSEYVDPTLTNDMAAVTSSEPGNLSKLASADRSNDKVSEIGRSISEFLERLPQNIVSFYNEYRLPVVSFAVLIAAMTALRILLAITDALNDIPLVAPFFELIGFGYVTWFVFRYFLKASTRQELAGEIDMVKKQITDDNAS